jgi:hypothetical protein
LEGLVAIGIYNPLVIVFEHQTLFVIEGTLDDAVYFVYSADVSGHIKIFVQFLACLDCLPGQKPAASVVE